MNLKKVLDDHGRSVVIVHYRALGTETPSDLYNGGNAPQNPACLLQVTLLPEKISPSGKLIRLGDTKADEIMGWTKIDCLEVVEVLGTLQDDDNTVVPIQWPPPWSLEAKKA